MEEKLNNSEVKMGDKQKISLLIKHNRQLLAEKEESTKTEKELRDKCWELKQLLKKTQDKNEQLEKKLKKERKAEKEEDTEIEERAEHKKSLQHKNRVLRQRVTKLLTLLKTLRESVRVLLSEKARLEKEITELKKLEGGQIK